MQSSSLNCRSRQKLIQPHDWVTIIMVSTRGKGGFKKKRERCSQNKGAQEKIVDTKQLVYADLENV